MEHLTVETRTQVRAWLGSKDRKISRKDAKAQRFGTCQVGHMAGATLWRMLMFWLGSPA
jgi:hypothetical protein